MLKLRIENFDKLPDGGPLEFEVDRRGFDLGRDQHLDWTLPDKNRVVSGKHCEVRFYDDAYWLFDVSTNGTFLNSNAKRMQSPYRLRDGDKISIGDYILAVAVQEPEPEPMLSFNTAMPAPAPPLAAPGASAIWEVSKIAPPPIDSRELMPPKPEEQRAADFLHHAMYVPPVADLAAIPKPQPARAGEADVWGTGVSGASQLPVSAACCAGSSAGCSSRCRTRHGAGTARSCCNKSQGSEFALSSAVIPNSGGGRFSAAICLGRRNA